MNTPPYTGLLLNILLQKAASKPFHKFLSQNATSKLLLGEVLVLSEVAVIASSRVRIPLVVVFVVVIALFCCFYCRWRCCYCLLLKMTVRLTGCLTPNTNHTSTSCRAHSGRRN